MKLCITTLSENAATAGDLLAEWGLSTLIETEEATVLLDAGQSISAAHNARALGTDLSRIDRIVLSHGHYDHTGGLSRILGKMKKRVEVIAHPAVWVPRYRCLEGQEDRYIGMPTTRRRLEKLGAVFNLTTKPVKIADNIMTTGEIPIATDYEQVDPGLFLKEGSEMLPDQVLDDQAVIINTKYGLVVILGCAHRGIINTLYHAQRLTGVSQIHAVFGGSHLHNTSEERILQTVAALRDLGVQRLGLCHCTGEEVAAFLAQEFGEDFFYNHAGSRFDLLGD